MSTTPVQPTLSVIIPAYNEETNIEATVREVLSAAEVLTAPYELIVVDDCSTDGTAAVVERLMPAVPSLRLVRNPKNLGFGGAFQQGVVAAQMQSCVLVPGDNAVHSDSLRAIFSRLGDAEVIVPYVTNTEVRDLPRRLLSKLFVLILNLLSGLWLRYYNGFNVVPTQSLRTMRFTPGFAFSAQIVIRMLRAGHSYVEVPVQVHERLSGQSKAISLASLWSVAKALVNMLVEVYGARALAPFWLVAAALGALPAFLAHTPFRGEHWALLASYERADGLARGVAAVSHFVCFGVSRFQPVAFFAPLAPYLAFGVWFAGHYAASAALHVLYAVVATALFEQLIDPAHRSTRRGYAFQRYPLEAALLLAAFPAADTLTWTFFQYIQLAAALGPLCLVLVLRSGDRRLRALGYAFGAAATLLYEPFLCVMGLLAARALLALRGPDRSRAALAEAALPALFVASIASKYLLAFEPQVFTVWTGFTPLPLLNHRLGRVAYMFVLFVANLARALALPSVARRGNIYELAGPFVGHLGELACVAIALVGVAALRAARRARLSSDNASRPRALLSPAMIVGLSLGGMFTLISGARLAQPLYCTVQFRYAYVLLPFVFAPVFAALRPAGSRGRTLYHAALIYLVAVNAWSSASHVARVRRDMAPLSAYVRSLKARGLPRAEVVTTTERTLRTGGLAVERRDEAFLYNAADCLDAVPRPRGARGPAR